MTAQVLRPAVPDTLHSGPEFLHLSVPESFFLALARRGLYIYDTACSPSRSPSPSPFIPPQLAKGKDKLVHAPGCLGVPFYPAFSLSLVRVRQVQVCAHSQAHQNSLSNNLSLSSNVCGNTPSASSLPSTPSVLQQKARPGTPNLLNSGTSLPERAMTANRPSVSYFLPVPKAHPTSSGEATKHDFTHIISNMSVLDLGILLTELRLSRHFAKLRVTDDHIRLGSAGSGAAAW